MKVLQAFRFELDPNVGQRLPLAKHVGVAKHVGAAGDFTAVLRP